MISSSNIPEQCGLGLCGSQWPRSPKPDDFSSFKQFLEGAQLQWASIGVLKLLQEKELANKYTNELALETGCEKHAPLKSMSVCDPQNEMVRTGAWTSLSVVLWW